MEEIKWPVVECEACGFNLREATPEARDKANDAKGKLTWIDYCPKCGHGYVVGDRVLPEPTAEVLAAREAQAILKKTATEGLEGSDPEHQLTPGEAPVGEASGVQPDKRGADLAKENPDPENLINQESEVTKPKVPSEAGAIRPPGKGEYFCTKCASNHKETSGIGKRHSRHREA